MLNHCTAPLVMKFHDRMATSVPALALVLGVTWMVAESPEAAGTCESLSEPSSIHCVQATECFTTENHLAEAQPEFFTLYSSVVAAINIPSVVNSINIMVAELNFFSNTGNATSFNCIRTFNSPLADSPLIFVSKFDFTVILESSDGSPLPGPPFSTRNTRATVTFTDLLSFNDIRLEFPIDGAGSPVAGSEVYFFRTNSTTNANGDLVPLERLTFFPLIYSAVVSKMTVLHRHLCGRRRRRQPRWLSILLGESQPAFATMQWSKIPWLSQEIKPFYHESINPSTPTPSTW